MSRAFTREDDSDGAIADIGERPVSSHRNLVTPEGLEAIDAEVAALRAELAKAESDGERERIALMSRDLRYWNARRESAELSIPDPDSDVVRFGMTVTIEDEDGKKNTLEAGRRRRGRRRAWQDLACLADGARPVRQEGRRDRHRQRQGMGNRQARRVSFGIPTCYFVIGSM